MIYFERLQDGSIDQATNDIRLSQRLGFYKEENITKSWDDFVWYKGKKYLKNEINYEDYLKIEEYKLEHQEALSYLTSTDYIANKLAEAISKYIETGDNTDVIVLRATYKEQLEKREACRKRVGELNLLLKDY